MTEKDVLLGTAARARLLRGIDIMADAVKATLGPKGRNVLLDRGFGAPRISKDGVSVARSVELSDPIENMGAQMLREVATRTSELVGDGTTTATVLSQAIIQGGFKAEAAGMAPMDLKRGIDMAVAAVVEDLRRRARRVSGPADIAQVGTISANGDREVGRLIADAMDRVGNDGVITVEEAKSMELELAFVDGLQFDKGYVSPYFVTDARRLTAELEDPYILLHDKKLGSLPPLVPLLEAVMRSGKPLLVVAEDVEGEALAALVVNRIRGNLDVAAVKAPGFGAQRQSVLEDIAVLTGGELIAEETGMKLESVSLGALGRAAKVVVTKDDTTIIDGKGSDDAIAARCARIRREAAEAASDYDRDKLRDRLAKLAGGVAVMRVGGSTEFEVNERKDRVEDAVSSTRAAIDEGILPGGGAALLYAAPALDRLHPANHDQQVGIDIVRHALQSPIRQIAANAGLDGAVIVDKLLARNDRDQGFDAQAEAYRDMYRAGIIDPVKVVRVALQDAASIAALLVTADALVADRPAA